jgi:hypothetical protein
MAMDRQNVTVSLTSQSIRKIKVLAAKRSTSISGLLAQQIDALIGADEAWEKAERSALALLEKGFYLGGRIAATREELHER